MERERERKRKKKKRRRGRRDQANQGMDAWIFVWKLNSSMDLWNSKAWFS